MRGPQVKPIIIAAGGTGGHFFPAEALAAVLMQRGERVVLLTDSRSSGITSTVFENAERHVVAGAGLSGRSFGSALNGAVALLRGVRQARALMADLNPGAVVAFGGYPAIPPVIAARLMRQRPMIFLHEQNAVLGRANRLLAYFSDQLALTFVKTEKIPAGKKSIVLGNPVRPAIAALYQQGYQPPSGKIEILVLGGSLGAKVFGSLIPAALALLPEYLREKLVVIQQCRQDDAAQAQAIFQSAKINATLSPFFNNVAELLSRAHLVIARSGASTVAELAIAGRPAIFIPLPSAIDDHQRANADALADCGAAWRMDQALLTPQILANKIETLINNPQTLESAAAAATVQGHPGAAEKLADLVQHAMAGAKL
ncbi:MAG: undecaprenyldiphospho-muramoylpentapeptide beta-N-acetylglucosaminyltransferase [Acidocella sp.]|nr:undecaprenyldiphospho-muramoylpentapeptide beta-N-acetylglucosaminyltransferase [Acidocella sp.]